MAQVKIVVGQNVLPGHLKLPFNYETVADAPWLVELHEGQEPSPTKPPPIVVYALPDVLKMTPVDFGKELGQQIVVTVNSKAEMHSLGQLTSHLESAALKEKTVFIDVRESLK